MDLISSKSMPTLPEHFSEEMKDFVSIMLFYYYIFFYNFKLKIYCYFFLKNTYFKKVFKKIVEKEAQHQNYL